jgi:hypothetical protein
MNILVVMPKTLSECFAASSIIKILKRDFPNALISLSVEDDSCKSIFEHNKKIKQLFLSFQEELISLNKFDLLVNLRSQLQFPISAVKKVGFGFSPENDKTFETLYGKRISSSNLFSLYAKLAELKWQGEMFDLSYFPRSKSHKNLIGIFVENEKINKYVIENLFIENGKFEKGKFKQNFFKQVDEVNKYELIVTDDLLLLQIAVFLKKKNVYFLKTIPYNFNLKFSNNIEIVPVPYSLISTL